MLTQMVGGLRSAMGYVGAANLVELRQIGALSAREHGGFARGSCARCDDHQRVSELQSQFVRLELVLEACFVVARVGSLGFGGGGFEEGGFGEGGLW